MQIQQTCDPHLRACSMKVRVETPKQAMAPSRSLPRSASELGDPPSPFSSNPAHHPVSMPTTPAATSSSSASSSFGCIAGKRPPPPPPPTDSPPPTPTGRAPKPKPLTPAAAAAAAYYTSLWSPRRLMQRAARAFRSSRSRRVRGNQYYAADEEHAGSVTGKVSDVACAVSVGAGGGAATDLTGNDNGRGGAAPGAQEEQHHEVVPEKIIHEMNHHAPPVVAPADECETKTAAEEEEKETTAAAADAAEEVEVESPKKGASPAPEAADAAGEDVADKFVTVVKEAIKKHEEAGQEDEKKEAMKQKFQGSRVRTAMEARPESEQPRRREVTRSNDVIEEARSKLLEKRQCSRVRALVGAFETVMDDAKKDAAATPRHTPRHLYRQSA